MICITVGCFGQGTNYILWLLNDPSANQIITSCTKDQVKSFSFISPLEAQMCGHNLRNLQSALPRCAPRVFSISAGRGGARLTFRGAGQIHIFKTNCKIKFILWGLVARRLCFKQKSDKTGISCTAEIDPYMTKYVLKCPNYTICKKSKFLFLLQKSATIFFRLIPPHSEFL